MTIVILQAAALFVFALLLRGSMSDRPAGDVRERADRAPKR